ncbi:MAG: putative bifunctional diguanylate cyclase/phosphodiesterase [Pirellulaceae bacterium]
MTGRLTDLKKRVTRSYLVALGIVAVCSLAGFSAFQFVLAEQDRLGHIINISGRQRMLSQRVALAALRASSADTEEGRDSAESLFRESIMRFETTHSSLVHGDKSRGIDELSPSLISEIYFSPEAEVDYHVKRFIEECYLLLDHELPNEERLVLANRIFEKASKQLLPKLEGVVQRFEDHANRLTALTAAFNYGLCVVTLLALALEAGFIFSPLAKTIGEQTTDIQEMNERVSWAANHDPLTSLSNRRYLTQVCAKQFEAVQERGKRVGCIHIDLDDFKKINDTHGHEAGDAVLQCIGKRLTGSLRESEFVARFGGDEFVVLVMSIATLDELEHPAKRILELLEEPIEYKGISLRVGGSLGLALQEPRDSSLEEVLSRADYAMYESKSRGGAAYSLCDSSMKKRIQRERIEVDTLREALESDLVVPYFQPQICSKTQRVVGLEALARLKLHDGSILSPGQFLDLASKHGLLDAIDDSMLRRGLEAFQGWRAQGLEIDRVSFNFSAGRLRSHLLAERLVEKAEAFGIEPKSIGIEILESVFVHGERDSVIENVQRLHNLGFHIGIDDFGSGHAALNSLLVFPVDMVKLDRSLVSNVCIDEASRKIIKTVVNLSNEMGIESLAEGIETERQSELVSKLGCTTHQGFLYSPPVEGKEIPRLVETLSRPTKVLLQSTSQSLADSTQLEHLV